jgi:hypothetical protein
MEPRNSLAFAQEPTTALFSSGFPTKILCPFLSFPVHAVCLSSINLHYLITIMIFGEEYKLCSFTYYSLRPGIAQSV